MTETSYLKKPVRILTGKRHTTWLDHGAELRTTKNKTKGS